MPVRDIDYNAIPKVRSNGPGIFEYLDYFDFWSEPRSIGDTCAANGILLSTKEVTKLEKLNTV